MTDPIQYPSTTPLHGLPLLFPGQSQKEFFVNAAFSRCDALLHPAIEGEVAAEPVAPEDGQAWLVAANGTGAFAGRDGMLAVRQAGAWQFFAVSDGMTVLDRTTGQRMTYSGEWRRYGPIASPGGGTIVDTEARSAINQIIAAMSHCGIIGEI